MNLVEEEIPTSHEPTAVAVKLATILRYTFKLRKLPGELWCDTEKRQLKHDGVIIGTFLRQREELMLQLQESEKRLGDALKWYVDRHNRGDDMYSDYDESVRAFSKAAYALTKKVART